MENENFLSKFEWNNFNITALNILLSELSQNGEVFLVGIFDNQMRPIRNVSFVNTFRVNDMGLKVVPTKTKEMQMIGIDVFDNSNNNYTIFLGTKTNIDALRSVYSKIVPPFSEGGGVGIEDYYEMNFADGGSIEKTKEIITKKIGFSEELADYFISRSQKFAVWLADIILKEELSNWAGSKKEYFESKYAKVSHIGFNYNGGIRQILDWLQHPITPKQELRKLTFDEALEKAKKWHEELTVLGGDIDFKEPEKNQILKKYPVNSEGIEYYWVFIPSNYCDLESSRMGHCGRTGYGNTLISLRSVKPYGKGHTISDSHVTIAYGSDGLFYQVKGKKNQKPNEKYQPYIFDLIKEMLTNQEFKEKFNENETFMGFGSEYDSKEDYGYGDMSTDQIRELYDIQPNLFDDANGYFMLFNAGVLTKSDLKEINENNPQIFESFKNQNLLFENGIIDNSLSTLVKVEKSCDDVQPLLNVGRNISDDLIKNVLCGDIGELTDSWSYYYENPSDLVDNLNKENEQRVIDEISRITGLEKSAETASKVVDEETKEPKVMYHGSKNDFTIFNPKAEAINRRQNFEGFYFTGDKNRAESYSNVKLFEVFINIRNPLNRHLGEHLPSYKSLNYIREKYKGDFNKEYLEEKIFQLQRTGRNSFIDGEDMTKILIMDNYDGVFDGSFDYGDTVAFNSNQIKLADGTNTTFDSNNPDIRYEIGGIFHGSHYFFDKFSTEKIGTGIGQQEDGWGIYLTDDFESSLNYGQYIYKTTLFKGKNIDEYIFLDLKKSVKKDLVSNIVEALYKYYNRDFDINKFNLYYDYIKDNSLPKVDFNDFELISFDYSGYLFYKTLSRILGGDKKASLFLLDNGIDGLRSILENSKGVVYRTDYVIFDENAITIESREHLPNNYYYNGGSIPDLLSSQEVEQKLGRELHWWNDDIVYLSNIKYKKVYLRPEYKKVI
jgi:hypothetical protein